MRRLARALPLAAALLVAIAGLAAAQQPSASPSVDVEAKEPSGQVTVERARSFAFTVRNTSPSTPADSQAGADVVIHVTGVPEGWTASADPPSVEGLRPGQGVEVQVQVAVATGAAAERATLTVTADLYSPLEGLDPILGNVPGATQKASDSATLDLTVDDSVTRDVIEAIGPWIYAVLLLLVAAVLVAVGIAVAARRTLVRLASETRELAVAPGGKVAFAFRAEGLAKEQDTVLLQVSAVQEGWAAFLPVPELTLEPGQVQELTLIVIAPRGAAQDSRQAVLVTATSAKAPKGAASLEFVAVVQGPEDLAPAPAAPAQAAVRRKKE